MGYVEKFDVIVVGGGHAGCEAALVAARKGCRTLLLTHNLDTIGQMSCNPAIGGIGKTHLVKEVDALGGAMALATDLAGIQFRVLNASKGPAVRATRAQADRSLYRMAMRRFMEQQANLTLFQQSVDDLLLQGDRVVGVKTQLGLTYYAPVVVLTAGTFLAGRIHVGEAQATGGRAGDSAAVTLASRLRAQLEEFAVGIGRLKTGTPPRIAGNSVDYSVMTPQPGDQPLPVMSYLGNITDRPQQISCHITATTLATQEIIQQHLHRSPMYSGQIDGVGPRYCPSIEDKIVRFASKSSHQIFVEPEGLNTCELYPNGISTSLPYDVQVTFVRTIRGFEQAQITRPGYAIEYDYFDPQGLQHSLETKAISGLFFAGQINGTTGYEEAAAQGLLAGLNAALKVQQQAPWLPRRDQAYLGVLVDDLIRLGTTEPYRMFTSRAEFRLLLRQDNADLRLTELGYEMGIIEENRWQQFCHKREHIEREMQRLKNTWIRPETEAGDRMARLLQQPLQRDSSLYQLLKRPEVSYPLLLQEDVDQDSIPAAVWEQVEIQVKYSGYIDRQEMEIERLKQFEATTIPTAMDYDRVPGLSNEVRQKLQQQQPQTLGQMARIPGVTPAAVSVLMIYLKKRMGVRLQQVATQQAAGSAA